MVISGEALLITPCFGIFVWWVWFVLVILGLWVVCLSPVNWVISGEAHSVGLRICSGFFFISERCSPVWLQLVFFVPSIGGVVLIWWTGFSDYCICEPCLVVLVALFRSWCFSFGSWFVPGLSWPRRIHWWPRRWRHRKLWNLSWPRRIHRCPWPFKEMKSACIGIHTRNSLISRFFMPIAVKWEINISFQFFN